MWTHCFLYVRHTRAPTNTHAYTQADRMRGNGRREQDCVPIVFACERAPAHVIQRTQNDIKEVIYESKECKNNTTTYLIIFLKILSNGV
jgi:hypothetical protein